PREKVRLKAPLPGHDEKKKVNEVNDHEGMKGMLRYSAATMEVRQYYRRCLQSISQRIDNENKLVPSRLRAGLPANGDRDVTEIGAPETPRNPEMPVLLVAARDRVWRSNIEYTTNDGCDDVIQWEKLASYLWRAAGTSGDLRLPADAFHYFL
ncbi:hypothetical protein FOZ62_031549, partial [Perkinsus olseni]